MTTNAKGGALVRLMQIVRGIILLTEAIGLSHAGTTLESARRTVEEFDSNL